MSDPSDHDWVTYAGWHGVWCARCGINVWPTDAETATLGPCIPHGVSWDSTGAKSTPADLRALHKPKRATDEFRVFVAVALVVLILLEIVQLLRS